jgi:hypothetical protein
MFWKRSQDIMHVESEKMKNWNASLIRHGELVNPGEKGHLPPRSAGRIISGLILERNPQNRHQIIIPNHVRHLYGGRNLTQTLCFGRS